MDFPLYFATNPSFIFNEWCFHPRRWWNEGKPSSLLVDIFNKPVILACLASCCFACLNCWSISSSFSQPFLILIGNIDLFWQQWSLPTMSPWWENSCTYRGYRRRDVCLRFHPINKTFISKPIRPPSCRSSSPLSSWWHACDPKKYLRCQAANLWKSSLARLAQLGLQVGVVTSLKALTIYIQNPWTCSDLLDWCSLAVYFSGFAVDLVPGFHPTWKL